MKLTDTQKAFVYASYVLTELEKAGAPLPSLEIFSDTSCTLILPRDSVEVIRELAGKLLYSRRWEIESKNYIKLASCGGLMQGGKDMFDDRG